MKKLEKMRMTFKCKSCGADPVVTERTGEGDAAVVSCKSCGQVFGTVAQVRAEVKRKSAKRIQSDVQTAIDTGKIIRT